MIDAVTSSRQSRSRPIFWYAVLFGMVLGIVLSLEPSELSRWPDYESIRLGMAQDQVLALVDSSDKSLTGCGAHHAENRDSVCRFEDPWRGYAINFDLTTKRVNRKHFYFKRPPGLYSLIHRRS